MGELLTWVVSVWSTSPDNTDPVVRKTHTLVHCSQHILSSKEQGCEGMRMEMIIIIETTTFPDGLIMCLLVSMLRRNS